MKIEEGNNVKRKRLTANDLIRMCHVSRPLPLYHVTDSALRVLLGILSGSSLDKIKQNTSNLSRTSQSCIHSAQTKVEEQQDDLIST